MKCRIARALVGLAAVFIASLSGAQDTDMPMPRLVKDIAPATQLDPVQIRQIHPLTNGRVIVKYEVGREYPFDVQYWVFERATGKNVRLETPRGQLRLSTPAVAVGNRFFFGLPSDTGHPGLWVSDGTSAGTALLHNLNGRAIDLGGFAVAKGAVYFRVYVPDSMNYQLWRSDGTTAGTAVVAELSRSAFGEQWGAEMNGELYFVAVDAVRGVELLKTDGTPGGTVAIASLGTGAAALVQHVAAASGRVVVVVTDDSCGGVDCTGADTRVWSSDGTAAGTVLVGQFAPDPAYGAPTVRAVMPYGAEVLLQIYSASAGMQLWSTNGSPGDLRLLSNAISAAVVLGDTLLGFRESDASSPSLERYDPVSGLFTPVLDLPLFVSEVVRVGAQAYFADFGGSLWITDGSASGTIRLLDSRALELSGNYQLTALNDEIIFARMGPGFPDDRLWISDGTTAGTRAASDEGPSGGAYPESLYAVGEQVYFSAMGQSGTAPLWVSDGSSDGTRRVDEVSSIGSGVQQVPIGVVGDRVLLRSGVVARSASLWATQVASASLQPVRDDIRIDPVGSGAVLFKGKLYFTGLGTSGDTFIGNGLWRSDGSAVGTEFVETCEVTLNCNVEILNASANYLYFQVRDRSGGYKLWGTDGVASGSLALAANFPTSLDPGTMVSIGSALLFSVRDGQGRAALWRSDGTAQGTVMLTAIGDNSQRSSIHWMRLSGATAYFSAYDSSRGTLLWRSDGTAAGTAPVGPIPDARPSGGEPAVVFKGKLVFASGMFTSTGNGYALRLVDPTTSTSVVLGYFHQFADEAAAVFNDQVYFIADDGIRGMELWRSDGTPEGTVIVQDIVPGAGSSAPRKLTVGGGSLYLSADDITHGRELWVLSAASAPSVGQAPGNAGGKGSDGDGAGAGGGGGGGGALSVGALLALWALLLFRVRADVDLGARFPSLVLNSSARLRSG